MEDYISAAVIRQLREQKALTQAQLAERLGVSDKTVSKWETGRGLPDLALVQPLAAALGVSVIELFSGRQIINRNVSGNQLRGKFFVCPVCGNVIRAMGDALISCCGITLPACEAEPWDEEHAVLVENVEDEQFLSVRHPMTKEHYISFLAYVTSDRVQLVKLYPEGNAETRMQLRGRGILFLYCNRHGLMQKKLG